MKELYVFIIAGSLLCSGCAGCFKPTHYRNATWERQEGILRFRGDDTCAREPMPLNTHVDYAAFGDRWGFLWEGLYRDAGAINRTVTTRALYLAAADSDLNPVTMHPLLVEKSDPPMASFLFPTDRGVSVMYRTAKGGMTCALLDLSKAPAKLVRGTCGFSGQIAVNGGYGADWAVRYYKGHTYALTEQRGLTLMRSGAEGGEEEFQRVPGTEEITGPVVADFFIDESGVSVIWAPAAGPGRAGVSAEGPQRDGATFRYARWSAAQSRWTAAPLAARGDPGRLKVKFHRNDTGLFAFIQMGTRVMRQDFDPGSGAPGRLADSIDLAKYRTQEQLKWDHMMKADSACTKDECLIYFVAGAGATHVYSHRTGLHRYGKLLGRIRCGDAQCLEDSDAANVAELRMER